MKILLAYKQVAAPEPRLPRETGEAYNGFNLDRLLGRINFQNILEANTDANRIAPDQRMLMRAYLRTYATRHYPSTVLLDDREYPLKIRWFAAAFILAKRDHELYVLSALISRNSRHAFRTSFPGASMTTGDGHSREVAIREAILKICGSEERAQKFPTYKLRRLGNLEIQNTAPRIMDHPDGTYAEMFSIKPHVYAYDGDLAEIELPPELLIRNLLASGREGDIANHSVEELFWVPLRQLYERSFIDAHLDSNQGFWGKHSLALHTIHSNEVIRADGLIKDTDATYDEYHIWGSSGRIMAAFLQNMAFCMSEMYQHDFALRRIQPFKIERLRGSTVIDGPLASRRPVPTLEVYLTAQDFRDRRSICVY